MSRCRLCRCLAAGQDDGVRRHDGGSACECRVPQGGSPTLGPAAWPTRRLPRAALTALLLVLLPLGADLRLQDAVDPLSLPPHGTEVFIGGLNRAATVDQVREFGSEVGDVHSVKLIREPGNPSQNKGYGFVKYTTKEAAVLAMDRLTGRELADFPGNRVRVQPSQAKHRLFIGGLPHDLTRETLDGIVRGHAIGASGCRAAGLSGCCAGAALTAGYMLQL